MKLLAALIPLLQNLIIKFLAALGLTAITYTGLDKLISNFKHEITTNITGLSNDLLQFFYISGGGVALNIIFGALTFYITITGLTKLTTKFGSKN
ncbi:DUF2523 domain-containing protein [Kingella negevensis]|uniref:DUF2523 domain-containing protein n=1 Tax=Kingella negevensis TaxID=1522312 RepID=UPI002542DB96|nr:DUF2523 domain-containing protein [Kingella negevensis]WII93507.1 DUF2523 domain-containing protein [Kingella negevensis]